MSLQDGLFSGNEVNPALRSPGADAPQVRTPRLKGGAGELVLADTGPGIPPEIVSKIFDPF